VTHHTQKPNTNAANLETCTGGFLTDAAGQRK
jgi:hypothetical protein